MNIKECRSRNRRWIYNHRINKSLKDQNKKYGMKHIENERNLKIIAIWLEIKQGIDVDTISNRYNINKEIIEKIGNKEKKYASLINKYEKTCMI